MRQAAPPAVQGKWPRSMKKKTGEKNGFGKSSCRFSGVRSTTPGPAYYHDPELFTLEAKGPSFSKKGFGNAFISTEEKIAYPKDNGVPGPNAYKLPDLGENVQAGIKFGDGVKKSTIGICDKNVPGVNTYFVKSEYEQVWSHYMKKKSSASLCSKSDRLAKPQNVDPNAPGPGTYNVDPNANTVQKNFAWSKSKFCASEQNRHHHVFHVGSPTRYISNHKSTSSFR